MLLRNEIADVLRQLKDVQGSQLQLSQAFGRMMAEMQTERVLTVEKLKIHERLGDVERKQDQVNSKIDRLLELAQQHNEAIFGRDGRGGINAELAVIQQAGKIAAWVMGTTGVATIALVVNQFGKLLLK